ncbi:MAG: hypothetical protein AAF390_12615 [Pseudomonadota bacterium]
MERRIPAQDDLTSHPQDRQALTDTSTARPAIGRPGSVGREDGAVMPDIDYRVHIYE